MSNLCRNNITITGTDKMLIKFKSKAINHHVRHGGSAVESEFMIERLLPVPDYVGRFDRVQQLKEDWIDKNWGTPFIDPDCEELESTPTSYKIKLYSNSAPPLPAFENISRDYPGLKFEIDFYGLNSGYLGKCSFKNGEHFDYEVYTGDEYNAQFVTA